MSRATEISDAVAAALDAATGLSAFPAALQLKAPSLPPGLEPPQLVVTVADDGDAEDIWAGAVLVKYPVAVTIVTAGGTTLGEDATLRTARELIRKLLHRESTYAGVVGLNRTTAGLRLPYDPAGLDKTLNYSTVSATVEVIEDAG